MWVMFTRAVSQLTDFCTSEPEYTWKHRIKVLENWNALQQTKKRVSPHNPTGENRARLSYSPRMEVHLYAVTKLLMWVRYSLRSRRQETWSEIWYKAMSVLRGPVKCHGSPFSWNNQTRLPGGGGICDAPWVKMVKFGRGRIDESRFRTHCRGPHACDAGEEYRVSEPLGSGRERC